MTDPIRIIALGDSLTDGFGVGPHEGYTVLLEKLLRRAGWNCRVVNAGVCGDTCRGALRRLPRILDAAPDLVILEIGVNDVLMGAWPDRIQANLSAIVETLSDRRVPVILAGMELPPTVYPDTGEAFAAVYPAVAERFGVPLLRGFTAPLWGHPERLQFDGLHPTAAGYAAITDHILPGVLRALEELRRSGRVPGTAPDRPTASGGPRSVS